MKLLLSGTARYDPGTKIGPARFRHHDLFLVKQGQLRFVTPTGFLSLCADDAVWIPPGVRFSADSLVSSSAIWVTHFARPGVSPSRLAARNLSGVWYFPGGASSGLANQLMTKLDALYIGNALWPESATAYFGALLRELSENGQRSLIPATRSLDELTGWASENLSRRIGVRDLAERAGLSEAKFRAIFQAQARQSPGEFLLELKMRKARKLLLESPMSIKEIGDAVGYSETASFHHAFAAFFKVSPGVYRSCRRKGIV